MAKTYDKVMDEIYGLKLGKVGDEIPSRHFGFYPPEEPEAPSISVAQKRYIKEIAKYIKKGSYILDIGCAFGETAVWLARNLDCRVLGIDIVEAQTNQANEFAKKFGLEDKIEFKPLDACKMDFAENTFDYIVSLGVLVHVPDKQKVFENAYRALKVGGGIAFSDPTMGEKCPWMMKKIASWVTFNVSFMKTVKEYSELMESVGFKNIEVLDVTETAFIKTWNLSRKEKYKTVLEPFETEGDFYSTPFMLNIARSLAMPGLKRRHWGWHFFWAEKTE